MVAGMPQLYSDDESARQQGAQNSREVSRVRVARDVTIASTKGDGAQATIRDISTNGCSIDTSADWLRLGGFISIVLEQEEAIMGIVRWLRDGTAGIEFLRPIIHGQVEWQALIEDSD